jgi:hypothetical protein
MTKTCKCLASSFLTALSLLAASASAHAESAFLYRIESTYLWGSGTLTGWFRAAYNTAPSSWTFQDFHLTESAGLVQGYETNQPAPELKGMYVPEKTYDPRQLDGPGGNIVTTPRTERGTWFQLTRELGIGYSKPGETGGFGISEPFGETQVLGAKQMEFEVLSSVTTWGQSTVQPLAQFTRSGLGLATLLKVCR